MHIDSGIITGQALLIKSEIITTGLNKIASSLKNIVSAGNSETTAILLPNINTAINNANAINLENVSLKKFLIILP